MFASLLWCLFVKLQQYVQKHSEDCGTGSILLTRVSASIMHGNSLETLLTVLQPSSLLARPYNIPSNSSKPSLTHSISF
jgi:hypothetical protein